MVRILSPLNCIGRAGYPGTPRALLWCCFSGYAFSSTHQIQQELVVPVFKPGTYAFLYRICVAFQVMGALFTHYSYHQTTVYALPSFMGRKRAFSYPRCRHLQHFFFDLLHKWYGSTLLPLLNTTVPSNSFYLQSTPSY